MILIALHLQPAASFAAVYVPAVPRIGDAIRHGGQQYRVFDVLHEPAWAGQEAQVPVRVAVHLEDGWWL